MTLCWVIGLETMTFPTLVVTILHTCLTSCLHVQILVGKSGTLAPGRHASMSPSIMLDLLSPLWGFLLLGFLELLSACSILDFLVAVRALSVSSALMTLFALSMNSRSIVGVLANFIMNRFLGHTPPKSIASVIFSSWSFAVMRSLLN